MQIPTTKKVYEAETILKALEDVAVRLSSRATAAEALLSVKKLLEKAPTVEVYCAQDTDKRYANIQHIHTKKED